MNILPTPTIPKNSRSVVKPLHAVRKLLKLWGSSFLYHYWTEMSCCKCRSFATCRFFPLWQQWWCTTGRCLRLEMGRAPPKEMTRSLPLSSCVLVPALEEDRGVPRVHRCFSQAPCRGRPTLRWGEGRELHPAGCGCLRWAWWGWWSPRCLGCLFWMPAPHLTDGRQRHDCKAFTFQLA